MSWIPVASVKAQRRLTVWPGYDDTSGSTFTRWPSAAENRKDRQTWMWVISFLFKQKRGNTERQQMNGGIKPVDDKWRQCRNVCLNPIHQGTALVNQNNEAFWENKKKKKKRIWAGERKSFLFHAGHKSYRWVMLLLSLPFSLPTHSCITAKSQNKHRMFFCGVWYQWVWILVKQEQL